MRKFIGSLPQTMHKLLPTIFLIVIAVLAGATDVFSARVREMVSKIFQDYASKAGPFLINALIALIVANVLWLLYSPVLTALKKVLTKADVGPRGFTLALQSLKLVYVLAAAIIIFTFFAPDLSGKFVLGFSVLTAAITLALQGAANDFVSGMLLQFGHRLKPGDEVSMIGVEGVTGQIAEVGYFSTRIKTEEGEIVVPNREFWLKPLKISLKK